MSSALLKLTTYLPVQVGTEAGRVQQLSPELLLVEGLAGSASVGEVKPVTLFYRAEDVLQLTGRVVSVEAAGTRVALEDSPARERLVALVSSLRKTAHLTITTTRDVESRQVRSGFARWRLPHEPLPELHCDQVDLSVQMGSRTLGAPLMVAGMTGGSAEGGAINHRIAAVAARHGLAMGLGSQRSMLEDPAQLPTFALKRRQPELFLVANMGAVQLNYGLGVDDFLRAAESVEADALAVHLNPLQEAVQPEGDRDFRNLWSALEELVRRAHCPVWLKETGAGVGPGLVRRAQEIGIAAIDVGGTGGTSWGYIEGLRGASEERRQIGETFRDWGIPTAEALVGAHAAVPGLPLIATGGLRTGLDVALAVALGARLGAMALPFVRAAAQGEEALERLVQRLLEEIRIAMFCAGCADVPALASVGAVER